ncbi:MAG: hypothetical protein N3D85_01660 [Candidatus Bathyarchaeota archaeon]|nr:hypothetical protein [Candidatus Bathyarchaeota archaeon]
MKKTTVTLLLLTIVALASSSIIVNFASARCTPNFGSFVRFGGGPWHSNQPESLNLVRINGLVTKWGTSSVNGSLSAQAKTAVFNVSDSRQMALVNVMWTTNSLRPLNAVRTAENFTYTFYSARLNNSSISAIDLGSTNFFINGTWNLYNVTTIVTITTNSLGQITNIHRETDTKVAIAYGKLTVTDNWTTFKLEISGIAPLSGTVARSRTCLVDFNPFKFSDEDGVTSNRLTRNDVRTLGRACGSMPGWGNYDQSMDFNNNYRIDIADLCTVAAKAL